MPATATATPRAQKPLSERVRVKLLRLARSSSEGFARAMMAAATALDDASSDGADTSGIEFVDSLNGIDVYEDTALPRSSTAESDAAGMTAATRLRSFCHIEGDIVDVVHRLTASVASPHGFLSGIVETQELCSVLGDGAPTHVTQEKEFPERAGINWFVLTRESGTRDSASSFSQSSVSTVSSNTRDRTSSSACSSGSRESSGEEARVEFIVLSYQGIFKHRGRRGWVQWCQSVELSSFPLKPNDPTRGVMFSSGIVAVESVTRPGQVSMSYAMGLDLSCHDERERRCLEHAVWKRVMKLAALKKMMQRESLSRTLSITSADTVERSSQSSQEVSPTTKTHNTAKQPECEPPMKIQELRTERIAKPLPAAPPPVPSKPIDKRRQRAQTMQPTLSSSPFRDPDSLEFRLSLYNDPGDLPDFSPESPTALQRATRETVGSVRFGSSSSVTKPSKGGRPKSRSVGTGWAL